MSEHTANKALSETARLRSLALVEFDDLERTQPLPVIVRRERQAEASGMYRTITPDTLTALDAARARAAAVPTLVDVVRERRKPSTVGTREERTAAQCARDVFADRQQELIEAGVWPVY